MTLLIKVLFSLNKFILAAGLLNLDDDVEEVQPMEEEEATKDHHLRLSKTGRNHQPSWYLYHINKFCREGNTQKATEVTFYDKFDLIFLLPSIMLKNIPLSFSSFSIKC